MILEGKYIGNLFLNARNQKNNNIEIKITHEKRNIVIDMGFLRCLFKQISQIQNRNFEL